MKMFILKLRFLGGILLLIHRQEKCFGLQSGSVVALKKVPLKKIEEGIPNTALRFHSIES